jgi:hypothetical protein
LRKRPCHRRTGNQYRDHEILHGSLSCLSSVGFVLAKSIHTFGSTFVSSSILRL